MDIMSLIGLLGAAGLMFYGMVDGGSADNFISASSVAITVGGTFAALMITFPLKVFVSIPKLLAKVFLPRIYDFDPQKYVSYLYEIAYYAKKDGILSVEEKIPEYKDGFLRKAVQLAVDSEPPENIREIMETELGYMIERHKSVIKFFEKGAIFAPGFGMLGTLAGLINMLMQAQDPIGITRGMAGALVTTFYGLILANVIFLPIGNKLQKRSDGEVLCRQLTIEGIISVLNGETPLQIQGKLISYIPPHMRNLEKIRRRIGEEEA